MSLLDDVKKMQTEGKTDDEIADILREKNIPESKIEDAFSQLRIRSEIVGEESQTAQEIDSQPEPQESPIPQPETSQDEYEQSEQVYAESPQEYAPPPQQTQQQYAPQYSQQYQYSSQSPQMSSDLIAEVAEEILAEKISPLRDKLEKLISIKTSFDAKTASIDERLKRIEQIIDRLQLSILQRVGSYLSEVDSVKKELAETQKSFKAINQKQKSPAPQQSPQHQTKQLHP